MANGLFPETQNGQIGDCFFSVANYLLAAKYDELEDLQAQRTTLRKTCDYGDSWKLKNIAEDIAEVRKVIRGLHKESDAYLKLGQTA
jgi:hypothetical protein